MPQYEEPPMPMKTAAIAIHELFATLVSVGFTDEQALKLCATLMERTAYA